MKLLVITQKVDAQDDNLGSFVVWLESLASRVDHVYVICLQKGTYTLPANVTVLSLGKEIDRSRFQYIIQFYRYIWRFRNEYDGVFIHMNPEYIVLGGWLWRFWHKKVLLWYTHKAVDLKLRLAVLSAGKIFTASKESFRLASKKVEVVGHGIVVPEMANLNNFKNSNELAMLTVGRISRSKDLATIIRAIGILRDHNPEKTCRLDIIGAPITGSDKLYARDLVNLAAELKLAGIVHFVGAMTHAAVLANYQKYNVFVHTSTTGSIDRAVLEALAAGLPVATSSEAFAEAAQKGVVDAFPPGDYQELAKTLEKICGSGILTADKLPNQRGIDYVRKNHNLETLIGRIVAYFSN